MDDEMIEIEEVEEEKETQVEGQTGKGRKETLDSELKKTRIEIPGLY
jgi:hypothetical protein